MANRVRRRQHNEATIWFIREGVNHALELGSVTSRSNGQGHRKAGHDCLNGAQHANRSYRPRIAQYGDSGDAWDDLLERAQPFPAHCVFEATESGDVAAWTRQAIHESLRDWVQNLTENKRDSTCRLLERRQCRTATTHNHFGRKAYEFRCQWFHTSCFTPRPAGRDPQVPAFNPTQVLKPSLQSRYTGLPLGVALGEVHEDADVPLRLLRARRERPGSRRAAEQRDELAPFHSITSSAATSSLSGTVRPSAFAVLRLMPNSNFTVCWTGKSPGFSPFRIRPA
jgi:hypothetical protein